MTPARPSESCPTCWPRACDPDRPYCRRIEPPTEPPTEPVLLVDLVAHVRTAADARPVVHPLGRVTLTGDARHDWRDALAAGLREAAATVDPPRPGRPLTPTDRLAQLDGIRAELDVLHDDVSDDVDPMVRVILRRARGDLDDAVDYLADRLEEEP